MENNIMSKDIDFKKVESSNEFHTLLPTLENTDKEEFNLIKALTDYIDWYGCRDSKIDKILPIEQQEGIVVTAMTLLKELT
ncbi:hypothetical protein Phi10:1_gp045 [Cellulophaga phage phi10:1]|uniref:Uncharacterized protein n=1 Tax=Cellulophaga phage phi10:1 TaxID=1327981 RepID=R9ZZ47_9CAUD|nr:hypothetical protein Phi10:1_gp045 [Cellulophaga phage phi10:1]AGO48386.1 hypothetical protein Phi10:1_gp045 [Cellulophaga phage phi10:1]